MITKTQAYDFANDWIASWNAHDLTRVMSHYDDDVEYYSMFLLKLTDNKKAKLQGKAALKDYLAKGLIAYPNLHFELKQVYIGVASVTLQYKSVNNLMAAEVFELNDQGLAIRVQCHYDQV